MTTEALVKPTTIQEQVLGKIDEMRQRNLTAKQKEKIDYLERRLISGFKYFAWHYFGVNEEQIHELSDQEIEALFLLVSERTRKRAIWVGALGIGIPFFGWSMILPDAESLIFTRSINKLKQMLGNGFNSAQIVRSRLNQ